MRALLVPAAIFRGFSFLSAACELLDQGATAAVPPWPGRQVDLGDVMKKALLDKLTRESEPLSRLELWLGVITMYLVLSAFLMGQFASHTGAAEKAPVIPLTNRA